MGLKFFPKIMYGMGDIVRGDQAASENDFAYIDTVHSTPLWI